MTNNDNTTILHLCYHYYPGVTVLPIKIYYFYLRKMTELWNLPKSTPSVRFSKRKMGGQPLSPKRGHLMKLVQFF